MARSPLIAFRLDEAEDEKLRELAQEHAAGSLSELIREALREKYPELLDGRQS